MNWQLLYAYEENYGVKIDSESKYVLNFNDAPYYEVYFKLAELLPVFIALVNDIPIPTSPVEVILVHNKLRHELVLPHVQTEFRADNDACICVGFSYNRLGHRNGVTFAFTGAEIDAILKWAGNNL